MDRGSEKITRGECAPNMDNRLSAVTTVSEEQYSSSRHSPTRCQQFKALTYAVSATQCTRHSVSNSKHSPTKCQQLKPLNMAVHVSNSRHSTWQYMSATQGTQQGSTCQQLKALTYAAFAAPDTHLSSVNNFKGIHQ